MHNWPGTQATHNAEAGAGQNHITKSDVEVAAKSRRVSQRNAEQWKERGTKGGRKRFKKFTDAHRRGVMTEDEITGHRVQHDLIDAEVNGGSDGDGRNDEASVNQTASDGRKEFAMRAEKLLRLPEI